MKKLFPLISILLVSTVTYGQDYKIEFEKYFQEGDTIKQFEALLKWDSVDPTDPELFTSYFNYYFLKSRKEVLSMTTEEPIGEILSFQDSTGKTAGYLVGDFYYNQEAFEKAMKKIDQGIELYPDRLDMRFGKIYALGEAKEWKRFTEEIVKAIQYSNINDHQWTWTNDEKQENGKDIFLSSLQDYQLALYETGKDELLVNMRSIAEEILKFYPNHVESLSNLSITYLLMGEYEKGIEPLLKAERIAPEDVIVLGNIAQAYKLKGDKTTAIEYFEKVIQYGDKGSVAYAKQQIEELKK